jgi:Domain of unknown function (DUF1508)
MKARSSTPIRAINVLGVGGLLMTSETYERKASALNGIESVKNNAPGAEVDDQTGE